jgi:glucose/arabinose dehydrogenase
MNALPARRRAAIALALLSGAFLELVAAQPALPNLRMVLYASGFAAPVGIVQDPTDTHVQFVLEQGGRIRTVVDGTVQPVDFLDLTGQISSGGERGLLGLAFPPDAAVSRRFFLNFTNPNGDTVVARFARSANPRIGDPASRFDLLWSTGLRFIQQPFANHNGGCLQFGPDGYLYIGMGDGGSGDDPLNNAQNPDSLLGKMLRIDVAHGSADSGFAIPPTNPFISSARPEIWAFGMRNPWRFSFDSATGALVIADVGQGQFEEIDYQPAGRGGRNFGWRNREGKHDHVLLTPPAFTPLTDPIFEYDHTVGQSITGGYVYRGALNPQMQGRYVFGDFIQGKIWSLGLALDAAGEATATDVMDHTAALGFAGNISSFGVDAAGEVFIVDYTHGVIQQIRRGAPKAPTNFRIIKKTPAS